MVTEYLAGSQEFHVLAFKNDEEIQYDFTFNIENTPCQTVVDNKKFMHIPGRVLDLYPNEPDSTLQSYMGVPLLNARKEIIGHLAVVDTKPMPEDPRAEALFRIFADRAGVEVERRQQESEVRERESRYFMILESAMDAMMELDSDLNITQLNPAAEALFNVYKEDIRHKSFCTFLDVDHTERFKQHCKEVLDLPEMKQNAWLTGFFAQKTDGEIFPFEAALSSFEIRNQRWYTLVLRDINQRLQFENRIETLQNETQYLREELKTLQQFRSIIGNSKPIRELTADIRQVAPTDATVLILGETGTGKEVIARTVHQESTRAEKPLICVNCAAIPSALMESEFFGHEKGAFTGASEKRVGRFAMADGGTIFLDELGELSLDLQAKLLRVLQEGEFEPVGSSKTTKVNVRVVAATNQSLEEQIKDGSFREDLFYRLNVFPLNVPPLRDRGEDVIHLAEYFMNQYASTAGRKLDPLTDTCKKRLLNYPWPGNVRELQNIIERGVITAQGNKLNLDRAIPTDFDEELVSGILESDASSETRILTHEEFIEFERQNIIRALKATEGHVSGENGAAALMGLKPSTLSSRIKALKIDRSAL